METFKVGAITWLPETWRPGAIIWIKDMEVMKFRKKPVVIDAMQFVTNNEPGDVNMNAIVAWINNGKSEDDNALAGLAWHNGTDIHIPTLEGIMTATVKDWIICGVKGEFYPCKADIFAATYEPA